MGWTVTLWKAGATAILLDDKAEKSHFVCDCASGEVAADSHGMLAPFADSSSEGSPCFGYIGV